MPPGRSSSSPFSRRRRSGSGAPGIPITAGLFAFVAVAAYVALIGALWTWFGWLSYGSAGFGGFHLSRLLAELLWVVATLVALARFRFPLLVSQFTIAAWLIVTDLISGGGDWSRSSRSRRVLLPRRRAPRRPRLDAPVRFWLHLAAGLLIGGSLIFLMHHGTVEWTLIAIASVVYVGLAQLFGRSSWAVLGALGLLLAAGEFTLEWTHVRVSLQSRRRRRARLGAAARLRFRRGAPRAARSDCRAPA